MKKIVLADMDGTLLDSQKRLPEELDKVISELKKQDVIFGVASGRQYYRLKEQFKEYDDMLMIAENGASVYIGNEIQSYEKLDEKLILEITDKYFDKYEKSVVYSGLKGSYVHNDMDDYAYENCMKYCANLFRFSDINEVLKNDKIVKIAFFIKNKTAKIAALDFEKYRDVATITVAACEWVDINGLGVSKGKALRRLKEQYHLSDEDCFVFGDYDNDIAMLKEAHYSYAMENAVDSVKKVANYIAPSNDEHGVTKVLIKHFNLEIK